MSAHGAHTLHCAGEFLLVFDMSLDMAEHVHGPLHLEPAGDALPGAVVLVHSDVSCNRSICKDWREYRKW